MEIAETRVEMSQTVDALQAKLAPDTLVEQAKEALSEVTERAVQEAKERAREAIQEATELAKDAVHDATVGKAEHMVNSATESAMGTGSSIMDTIRANPLPAAVAAVSLGWLFMKRPHGGYSSQNGSYTYPRYSGYSSGPSATEKVTGKVSDTVGGVKHAGERVVSTAGETLSDVADQATRTASSAGDALTGAASSAGRTSKDLGSTLLDTITANPVPAAITGIGLTWLWMNRPDSQSDTYSYNSYNGSRYGTYGGSSSGSSDSEGNLLSQAQDRAGEVVGQVQGRAGDVVDQVQGTAGDLAGNAQHQVHRARSSVDGMLQENPLMVGVVAAAMGAAVGMALPHTPQENQFMGEARESVMEQAKETAQDVTNKVQQVASEAQSAAQKAASEQKLTSS